MAARTGLLHQSERTRVTRLVFPDGTLIRKEPLGPDREKRRRQELAALQRLSGVDGVVQLASTQPFREAILLEDVRGEPLASVAKPLEVAALTALAVDLARVVAAVHRRGVMHRDINPRNVVLAERGRHPVVIDFALATTSAQLRPEFTHHTEIVGTLPYLAPEQTGRTGWPVDQRADLYALGATLYELATGEPPFGTGNPVQLIH